MVSEAQRCLMTPTQDPRSDERILKAQHLLETWDRLARAHTMIGAGCSCGIGGVVVALEDFEQDIVDYLQAEAERLGRADVLKCLDQTREGNLWSISRLLGGFSQPAGLSEPEAGNFVLERLTRTLRSFEQLHGSR
jgi:hypothetical protein